MSIVRHPNPYLHQGKSVFYIFLMVILKTQEAEANIRLLSVNLDNLD